MCLRKVEERFTPAGTDCQKCFCVVKIKNAFFEFGTNLNHVFLSNVIVPSEIQTVILVQIRVDM